MTARKSILNIADVELEAFPVPATLADRFEARLGELGGPLGSRQLGYMLTVVPPGKRAFPYHSHRVNEEMFFVIEGEGELRFGSERHPIRAGDVIACPAGGPEVAHQIVNTGTRELKYLGVSTMLSPEVVEYPDSRKFGVRAEIGPDADGRAQRFRFNGRPDSGLDYWDGE